jgi:hypothetical protein
MNYFFVATLLPELKIGSKPDITFYDLVRLYKDNLTLKDLEKIKVLRGYYDVFNIRFLLLGEPLDPYGNLNKVELEESIISGIGLPPYVYAYLNKYPTTQERLDHFLELIHNFFDVEREKADGVLGKILQMEHDFRIINAAFRAKKLNKDIVKELQYENPDDDLIAQILAQKDSKTFEPPFEYEDMKAIYLDHQENARELYEASLLYRFEAANTFVCMDFFSIERLLVYMYQLILAEMWQAQDRDKGIELIDNTVKEVL